MLFAAPSTVRNLPPGQAFGFRDEHHKHHGGAYIWRTFRRTCSKVRYIEEHLKQVWFLFSVVAVHGLYEDAIKTWTDPETATIWPWGIFPHKQLKARVLTYGYRAENLASLGEGTADRILPHATTLVAQLCAECELSNAIDRPIVFLCHGVGGILVKRALVFASTSRAKSVELGGRSIPRCILLYLWRQLIMEWVRNLSCNRRKVIGKFQISSC